MAALTDIWSTIGLDGALALLAALLLAWRRSRPSACAIAVGTRTTATAATTTATTATTTSASAAAPAPARPAGLVEVHRPARRGLGALELECPLRLLCCKGSATNSDAAHGGKHTIRDTPGNLLSAEGFDVLLDVRDLVFAKGLLKPNEPGRLSTRVLHKWRTREALLQRCLQCR